MNQNEKYICPECLHYSIIDIEVIHDAPAKDTICSCCNDWRTCKLVSTTATGATRGWASQTAGFDYNASDLIVTFSQ